MIIINNNNHKDNKCNNYNKQNTYQEKKQTVILIYYIQTMKRIPCLICNVNITFIVTKGDIYLLFMIPL